MKKESKEILDIILDNKVTFKAILNLFQDSCKKHLDIEQQLCQERSRIESTFAQH